MAIHRHKDYIVRESYLTLGQLALDIVRANIAGNSGTKKVKKLWYRAVKIRLLLRGLQFEDRLADDTINRYLTCLIKLADIRNFGAAPVTKLYNTAPQLLFTKGADGSTGAPGAKGDDALINVEPADGETQITVDEQIEGGIKTFNLAFTQYVAPSISNNINTALLSGDTYQTNKKIREEGETLTVPIKVTLTKGSQNVTGANYLNPVALDTDFQAALDLPTLNGSGSQIINLNDAGVSANKSYNADITDGIQTPTNGDSISFVYPFLFGMNATALDENNLYTQLTKVIQNQGDKSLPLDGTNEYAYFGYPSEYGALTTIKDGNGFNVTTEFERLGAGGVLQAGGTINVIAPAGAGFSGWNKEYIFYRTKLITDISSQTYQFIF